MADIMTNELLIYILNFMLQELEEYESTLISKKEE